MKLKQKTETLKITDIGQPIEIFLPGGTGPESYLEDSADTEEESAREKRPPKEETKSESLEQEELKRTLKKIKVELKEPKKVPNCVHYKKYFDWKF